MLARLLIAGVAWLAALMLFAALLQQSARRPAAPSRASTPGAAVAHAVGRPPPAYPGWTVIRATSAHHVMVVHVETEVPRNARAIARQIVEPLRDRKYAEVLMYFHLPGKSINGLAARRIQWTPRGGYDELIYDDAK